MEVISQTKQTGADVINIAFARPIDIHDLRDDLQKQMVSTGDQPEFFYSTRGSLITLFCKKCGELLDDKKIDMDDGVPSICLTFNGPAGRMFIVNAHWPALPRTARVRLLDEYVNPAPGLLQSIRIIGGHLAAPVLPAAQMHHQGLDYQVSACRNLCVLIKTFGLITHNCFPVESSAADVLITQLWNEPDTASAVQPIQTGNVLLRARTPLCDKFLENLDFATESKHGLEVVKFIQDNCFFGDPCCMYMCVRVFVCVCV